MYYNSQYEIPKTEALEEPCLSGTGVGEREEWRDLEKCKKVTPKYQAQSRGPSCPVLKAVPIMGL